MPGTHQRDGRNPISTDTVQRIYCRTSADAAGNESVRCFAVSAANASATCFSALPPHVRSAQSAGDASFIYFTWDVNGVCQSIDVLKGSHLEPKAP